MRKCSYLAVTILLLHASFGWAQVNVLTQHNDVSRTGANLKETSLNTSNVKASQFGKLFKRGEDVVALERRPAADLPPPLVHLSASLLPLLRRDPPVRQTEFSLGTIAVADAPHGLGGVSARPGARKSCRTFF